MTHDCASLCDWAYFTGAHPFLKNCCFTRLARLSWLSCETAPLAPKARNHGMLGPRVGSVVFLAGTYSFKGEWHHCLRCRLDRIKAMTPMQGQRFGAPIIFKRKIQLGLTTKSLQDSKDSKVCFFELFGLTIFRWQ